MQILWIYVLLWVALRPICGGSAVAPPGNEEALLLLDFKSGITYDPFGTLHNWTLSSSHCSWNSVTCNAEGSVIALNISNLQLSGNISPSLALLHNLTILMLSSNNFSGSLPAPLLAHSSLLTLDLSFNNLSGSIPPPGLCSSSLSNLILNNNSFSGAIPPSLGNCTNLQQLALYGNALSGFIPPQLGSLSHLQILSLSFNQLVGNIPVSIFTNCTKLTILALSINGLTGSLPPQVGFLRTLQQLWIDNNQLSGKIPEEIGNLTQLRLLRMDTNEFAGNIPPSIGQLVSLTELLNLALNQLTGSIPPQLGNLTNLAILALKGNSLSGIIPAELGKLQNLHGLFLEDNLLVGRIPSELGQCLSLEQVRLDGNRLTGSIPSKLGNLQLLTTLYLDRNLLQGNIPSSFSNLTRLQDLSLGYNALYGYITDAVANPSTLEFSFSVPHNSLTGPLPAELGGMINVQKIDLSWNKFSGVIPASLGNCVNLVELNLSYNSLTGTIPESFASLMSLQVLDLTGNLFSGTIPASLSNLSQLQYLDLSFNNFTGQIPALGVFRKLNASSFLSNPGLCGPPLTRACPIVTAKYVTASSPTRGLKIEFKILIVFGSLFALAILLLCLRCAYDASRQINRDRILPMLSPRESDLVSHLKRFTAQELQAATDNFSKATVIGRGGLSTVYRGTNLTIQVPSFMKTDAAIKLLPADQRCPFSVELKTLGSIRHRNLVGIHGYCDERNVQALVLEFLPKGSLHQYLHADEAPRMSLQTRLQLLLGVAHGMAYLHHGLRKQIVHRDLKPSNILLDEDMVAKVADFGIAKLLGPDTLYSKASGSPGYIAPEYGESTRVTAKGDVYSFGIVVLEMLTRKEPTNEMFGSTEKNLPDWVREAYPQWYKEILDPELRESCIESKEDEALRTLVEVGLTCVQMKPERRPNMETVVTKLTSIVSSVSTTEIRSSRDVHRNHIALFASKK